MIIRKYDNKYIIRILNNKLNESDYYNQEKISDLFKNIILKIKEKYTIKGLLDIDVYINKYYGMIIEIEVIYSELEEIDMRIHFHLDTIFLIETTDYNSKDLYYYKNKFYTIYNNISDNDIIYKTKDILTKGIRIT